MLYSIQSILSVCPDFYICLLFLFLGNLLNFNLLLFVEKFLLLDILNFSEFLLTPFASVPFLAYDGSVLPFWGQYLMLLHILQFLFFNAHVFVYEVFFFIFQLY